MNSKHIKNMDLPASRSHFNNLKNTLDNGKSCGIVFSSLVCFQLQNVRCLSLWQIKAFFLYKLIIVFQTSLY